ncbi:MAG: indole-3-glycerol-phosphate synthase [Actinobacteria bacterium]|nr:indole-3-glycerol-phosphate synthase [Actinomycetota bacterium]
MTLTYLDAIIAHHRQRAAADQRTLSQARTAAESQRAAVDASSGAPGSGRGGKALRDFAAALQGDSLMVIAEIKRRSPSRGALNESLDPRQLAKRYAAGGAACLSVLTDGPHFGGSAADLQNARAATTLPVLRKERRALRIEPRLIGVNQRDLRTFEVDRERAVRVAGEIPEGVVGVAESGITGMADAARLAAAGYRAVLVGEHLVTSRDVEASLADLRLALPS